MSEKRLAELLRKTPVPGEAEAEQRGLRVVMAAFAERERPRRQVLPRLGATLAATVLLGALVLSPAGAAVRGWIGDVFATGVPNAERALTQVPGGGHLLVQAPNGTWVVQPDGSRRLLGSYRDATWSPRGLFVGATSGRTLSAIEPDGDPRWSLSAGAPVTDPRWSPSGFRIGYRAGQALRVVAADGTGDALLAPRVAAVPAVWSPQGLALIAYIATGGGLRIANTETAEVLGSTKALAGASTLDWAADGSMLLEASRHSLRLHDLIVRKILARIDLDGGRRVALPDGATIRDAAFAPEGETIAVLLERQAGEARPARSELVLIDSANGSLRRLFSVSGRLSDLTWSPDGTRLLVAWRDADQWLFIPVSRQGRVRAIGGISGEFAPGAAESAAFPRVEGWCCTRTR